MRDLVYNNIIIDNTFLDLKDVLLLDKELENTLVVAEVTYSRYKIIMSNYMALNGLHFPNRNMADETDYFYLHHLNERNNTFKIIKKYNKDQEESWHTRGNVCSCTAKEHISRWRYKINGNEKCFYCMRIERNYTTPIIDGLQQITE